MNEEYTYNIDKYTITVDKYGKDKISLTIAIIENNKIDFLGSCNGNNAICVDLLIRENQKLRKQLEEKRNQQKNFIEYLNLQIKGCRDTYAKYGPNNINGYYAAAHEVDLDNYKKIIESEVTND